MENFWFYIKMGLNHVLDLAAYDHILFLSALAIPFTFRQWKKVVLLATVFTIAHCLSLFLSVYDIMVVSIGLIEFLIPVTIVLTAIFNLFYLKNSMKINSTLVHAIATAFFGFIHGFGFSNYFKMLMAEETDKLTPLLGFATGIEVSQILIVLGVLFIGYLFQSVFKIKQILFIAIASILIILVTIPLLINTFPI